MVKRCLSVVLVLVILLGLLPFNVFATTETEDSEVIFFEDGSYIVITIASSSNRSIYSKTGHKKLVFYDGDNNVSWEAKLSATYIYTGESATCTTASCTVTVYDNQWYEVSKSTTRSGNAATTQLTMGRKFLGVTVEKPEYTITLTCDKDGNLS